MDVYPKNSRTRQPWLLQRGAGEVLACGAAALFYVVSLAFGFVYDDVPQILKNPAIQSWRSIPGYFASHVWASIYPGTAGNYYRPLFLIWLRLNYAFFGTNPTGWHLTSVACHVFATWLVFRLAVKLGADRIVAFSAALIFGVHPAHVESVAWISGVVDPLVSCLVLLSFLSFLDFHESRRDASRIFSLCWFGLALLTKETAVVLPGVIGLYAFLSNKTSEQEEHSSAPGKIAIPEVLPYLLLLLVYGCARYFALRGFSHATVAIPYREILLTWPSVLVFYVRHLILPYQSSEFYPLGYVSQASLANVILPIAVLAGLAITLWGFVRTMRGRERSAQIAIWISIAFLILPILPVLDLGSLTPGDIVHDRYLYLPSVGFAILAAVGLRELSHRLPRYQLAVELTCAIGIAAVLAAVTVTQEMQWADDVTLYAEGVKSAPDNLTVRDNLANALMSANHPEQSIPIYLDVLSRNPNFWRSNYNLGFAYYRTANYPAAEQYLKRANQIDSSDADQFIYLALAQDRQGEKAEAIQNARRAIERSPHARGYHAILGMIDEDAGDRNGAISEFQSELAEHPDNLAVSAELQKLQAALASP